MDAAEDRWLSSDDSPSLAACRSIIDFKPLRLCEDTTIGDAARLFIGTAVWGIPIVNASEQYVGTCTLRSIIACALPPHSLTAADRLETREQDKLEWRRREQARRRPVAQAVDLEVPAIRLSTALRDLLLVLCRRAPIVPIISDSGRRLLGVASLERAVRTLYADAAARGSAACGSAGY
jgi:CBS-domain-containing membrane protein